MKRCPKCNRPENDDSLAFCRADGARLVSDGNFVSEGAGTLRFDSAPVTGETETGILPTGEGLSRPTAPTTVLDAQRSSGSTREFTKPKSRRGVVIAAAVITAIALAAFAYTYLTSDGGNEKNSIAVLPFQNAGGDPNLEYLSDGISESLINSLSQVPGVRVMARSTMFSFKGRDADPRAIGKQLGVDTVLTGKVVQMGDSLSVQADLVNASDGSQIWGERYSRKASDILAVQEDIAREIVGKLRLRMSGEQERRVTQRYTEDPEAYQLYLKGRFYWNKRTEEGARKGIEFFQRAIDEDPNYALAYVGVADSYLLLGVPEAMTGAIPMREALPKARAAAERALEINDSLAEAHASLAHIRFIGGEGVSAEEGYRRSIDLNPNYATAHHYYALYLSNVGRFDEALRENRRAQELDPLSLVINTNVGTILYFARRYDEAIEQCRKTLDMDSTFALAHYRLGSAYEEKGMYREAIAEFRQAAAYSNQHPTVLAALAHAYAVSGDRGEAQKALDELTKLSERRYVSAYGVAVVHAGLGEKEQALRWLEKAVEQRDYMNRLKVDPRLDPLRTDPRFSELLRKVGLPQ
jgi:eukaryotic-like serine/threonine-protein kinase